MEDRETARMRKYGESKTTRIMMATVPHIISGLGLRKFQADGFLLTRVYTLMLDMAVGKEHITGSKLSGHSNPHTKGEGP